MTGTHESDQWLDLEVVRLRQAAGAAREQIAALEARCAAAEDTVVHLETALHTSRQIGAAIGILMATQHETQESAFEVLRVVSQDGNRKLHDIAEDVILTGTLPPAGAARRGPSA